MSTIGLLYPGHSAQDDFAHAERILDRQVPDLPTRFPVAITSVGQDAHEVGALLDLGSMPRLTVGVTVTDLASREIFTAAQVGTLDAAQVTQLVAQCPRDGAQALLVPDTAMHTLALLPDLEAAAGMPVLTANQVTVWEGLRLLGQRRHVPALGSLFARAESDPVLTASTAVAQAGPVPVSHVGAPAGGLR